MRMLLYICLPSHESTFSLFPLFEGLYKKPQYSIIRIYDCRFHAASDSARFCDISADFTCSSVALTDR